MKYILLLIVLSTCTVDSPILSQDEKVLGSEEGLAIEKAIAKLNSEYEILIDVVVSEYPREFTYEKSQSTNRLRIYLSPDKKNGWLILSDKLQEICSKRLITNVKNKILNKYLKQGQPVKAITTTSYSLVRHLEKKGALKQKEAPQDTAYLVFFGLILIFIWLVWYNYKSKNKIRLKDIWTSAYWYGD